MQQLRYWHRAAALFAGAFIIFLGVTGTLIQSTDLWSIYSKAPATDPNVQAMREGFDGPPGFAVRTSADYAAAAIPDVSALPGRLTSIIRTDATILNQHPVDFLEFRMVGTRLIARIDHGTGYDDVDLASGIVSDRIVRSALDPMQQDSTRNFFKRLHRMSSFGDWAVVINVFVALALAFLTVTGASVYLKLLKQRRKMRRPSLFWAAGGTWRSLHRAISLICIVFLAGVTLSGGWLAVDGVYRTVDVARSGTATPKVPVEPLDIAQLPQMLKVTLDALGQGNAEVPIKVIRLRNYGGYRQGVAVTGGADQRQRVINASTGASMSETEPGYPHAHFPWGWQAHQWAKSVHRGDFIGLTGRWMDLIAGFALIYLSISGGVMYLEMLRKRRAGGRRQLLWH